MIPKKILLPLSFLMFTSFCFSFFNETWATVGGPTLLKNFVYDEKNELVYYIEENYDAVGGKIVWEYHPHFGTVRKVIDTTSRFDSICSLKEKKCHEKQKQKVLEKLLDCLAEEDKCREEQEKLLKEFRSKTFKPLPRIDLNKNGIRLKIIPLLRERWSYSTDREEITLSIRVYQGEDEKGEFEFKYCYPLDYDPSTQEYLVPEFFNLEMHFDGFYIPHFDTILLIASRIDYCDETGYIKEKLFFLRNIHNIDINFSEPLPPRAQDLVYGEELYYLDENEILQRFRQIRVENSQDFDNIVDPVSQERIIPRNIGGIFIAQPVKLKKLPLFLEDENRLIENAENIDERGKIESRKSSSQEGNEFKIFVIISILLALLLSLGVGIMIFLFKNKGRN